MNPEQACPRVAVDQPQTRSASVYLSGPIAGYPDGNRALFARYAERVTKAGHIAVNPHGLDHSHAGRCLGDEVPHHPMDQQASEHQYGCYMKADLRALLDCDFILMLPNYMQSRGAKVELKVARICGLETLYWVDDIEGTLQRWTRHQQRLGRANA